MLIIQEFKKKPIYQIDTKYKEIFKNMIKGAGHSTEQIVTWRPEFYWVKCMDCLVAEFPWNSIAA